MPRFIFLLTALMTLPFTLIACSSPPGDESAETITQTAPEATMTAVFADTGPQEAVSTTAPPLAPTAVQTAEFSPYPGPTLDLQPTASPAAYPAAADTAEPYPPAATRVTSGTNGDVYLPVTGGSSITPSPQPTVTPSPLPTVDFAAVEADLEAQGQKLGFVKTGFHVTLPEDRELLDEWMTRLDEAGVPFFLKTVDNAEPLFKAQKLIRESGVPHVLVYRSTGSVPHYELPPDQAAQHHWGIHRDLFPPELDPSLVWVETLNEPDRTQSEWLAQFSVETARLAMAEGFRYAAFGFASGEPEPEHWRGPAMQKFLRLAGENPDQVAIALHEYSYLEEDIGHEYPYKVGRFQALFEAVDQLEIPRPTVLITEGGWEYADIPPVEDAMDDLKWLSKLYAAYPQVKGAAIWNIGVGCCFGDISEQVQEIIEPVTELSLRKYYALPAEKQPVNPAQFQP